MYTAAFSAQLPAINLILIRDDDVEIKLGEKKYQRARRNEGEGLEL
jgi:hypothetical protein